MREPVHSRSPKNLEGIVRFDSHYEKLRHDLDKARFGGRPRAQGSELPIPASSGTAMATLVAMSTSVRDATRLRSQSSASGSQTELNSTPRSMTTAISILQHCAIAGGLLDYQTRGTHVVAHLTVICGDKSALEVCTPGKALQRSEDAPSCSICQSTTRCNDRGGGLREPTTAPAV